MNASSLYIKRMKANEEKNTLSDDECLTFHSDDQYQIVPLELSVKDKTAGHFKDNSSSFPEEFKSDDCPFSLGFKANKNT